MPLNRCFYYADLTVSLACRHMLNVTWERKDLSFNNQGFLSNPSMVIIALDRDRTWDKVACFNMIVALVVRTSPPKRALREETQSKFL